MITSLLRLFHLVRTRPAATHPLFSPPYIEWDMPSDSTIGERVGCMRF